MYTMTPTANLSHAEWLALRKTGIGGSDAGALCGLNAYRSPIHVYKDKVSEEIEDFDNESMRQGRDLEEYVARRLLKSGMSCEETAAKVQMPLDWVKEIVVG